jgi:hypothetical protein
MHGMKPKSISAIFALASAAGLLAIISSPLSPVMAQDASVGTNYPDQYCQEDERIHEKYGVGSPEDLAFHEEEGKGPCADIGVDTSA